MIKRILDPEEFKIVANDIFNIHEFENENEGHYFLKHKKETIVNAFANKHLLAWDLFFWANHNGESYDAIIGFINDKNIKFGEHIFSEYIWLSKNPKVGYRLFQEAKKFARQKGFKYITMSRVMKHPNSESVKRFYEKMGFIKDVETFIAKL